MKKINWLILGILFFSIGCNKSDELDEMIVEVPTIDTTEVEEEILEEVYDPNTEFELQEVMIPEEYKCSNDYGGISIDIDDNIWIVCKDFCITRYQPNMNSWDKNEIEPNFGPLNNGIRSVLPDNEGGLWLGTMFRGLMRVKDGQIIESYIKSNSDIKANSVGSLTHDENGESFYEPKRVINTIQ